MSKKSSDEYIRHYQTFYYCAFLIIVLVNILTIFFFAVNKDLVLDRKGAAYISISISRFSHFVSYLFFYLYMVFHQCIV